MQCHERQQHSNNPLRFHCTMCEKALASKLNLRRHMEIVHADKKNHALAVGIVTQDLQGKKTDRPTCGVIMDVSV